MNDSITRRHNTHNTNAGNNAKKDNKDARNEHEHDNHIAIMTYCYNSEKHHTTSNRNTIMLEIGNSLIIVLNTVFVIMKIMMKIIYITI